jgi:drug/metabolite transporter (DMT)-like permease
MAGHRRVTTSLLAAFTASVTWAYATAYYSRASRVVGAARVNLARVVVALPTFIVIRLIRGGDGFVSGITPAQAAWLVGSVVCSYAFADSLFLAAARHIGITTALSIASTYPVWAAMWGAFVDGEPITKGRVLGTVLAVSGVVWLVRLQRGAVPSASHPALGGFVLAFIASLLWSLNSIGVKRGAQGLDTIDVTVLRFMAGFCLLVPQLFLPGSRAMARAPAEGWLRLLPALVADAVIGSLAYVYGLSHTDLAVGATLSSLAPLVSVPFAIALGQERWSVRRFAAVVTTVAGVALLVVP